MFAWSGFCPISYSCLSCRRLSSLSTAPIVLRFAISASDAHQCIVNMRSIYTNLDGTLKKAISEPWCGDLPSRSIGYRKREKAPSDETRSFILSRIYSWSTNEPLVEKPQIGSFFPHQGNPSYIGNVFYFLVRYRRTQDEVGTERERYKRQLPSKDECAYA